MERRKDPQQFVGEPVVAVDLGAALEDAVEIGVRPELVAGKEPPCAAGNPKILETQHRARLVELWQQEGRAVEPSRHEEESRGYQLPAKAGIEAGGGAEFLRGTSSCEGVGNLVRVDARNKKRRTHFFLAANSLSRVREITDFFRAKSLAASPAKASSESSVPERRAMSPSRKRYSGVKRP